MVRAVIQRVTRAEVVVKGQCVGAIAAGLVVLLGIAVGDSKRDATYLANKIINLRIFEDGDGRMNRSLLSTGGELLAVSQFTLLGDCRKGRRPSFSNAAAPKEAEHLYHMFVQASRAAGVKVETGQFRTEMMVKIHNQGPVTLVLDSRKEE
jgi:D-tyrosyl-tRNA(Tyr) deacylase